MCARVLVHVFHSTVSRLFLFVVLRSGIVMFCCTHVLVYGGVCCNDGAGQTCLPGLAWEQAASWPVQSWLHFGNAAVSMFAVYSLLPQSEQCGRVYAASHIPTR